MDTNGHTILSEDYCSYEVAKLLKEKGFYVPCRAIYSPKGVVRHFLKEEVYAKGHKKLCPTHQMAMKWLREVHNILLFILPSQENGKLVYLVEVWTWNEEEGIYESTYAPMPRKEPKQTVEAALNIHLKI